MISFERLEKGLRGGGHLAILRAVHQEDPAMGDIERPIMTGVQNFASSNTSIAQHINAVLQAPVDHPDLLAGAVMLLQIVSQREDSV